MSGGSDCQLARLMLLCATMGCHSLLRTGFSAISAMSALGASMLMALQRLLRLKPAATCEQMISNVFDSETVCVITASTATASVPHR